MKSGLIKRVFSLTALAALCIAFERTVRYWRDLAASNCGLAEAGGNCRSLQEYRENGLMIFFAAAVLILAVLILLPNSKSAGK
ncbi:hypothetical protein FHS95_000470 [Sphingomonas naasensis]|uniref:Uncharacterized protein n=1 Tax=Sphingomonas naasensis TaxID=1344951 RepID=A0A4S1WRK9_9SPHN|nr:hypothetical protein [Sphingomonas naasensis]NIJ18801.1 hypothetical protein [Sphingomonas naasensis]TGX46029.1 hypothetical protein E5A74_02320 [Sphingomonas naasensis]